MSKIKDYFDIYCDHHRFKFLLQDSHIMNYCKNYYRRNLSPHPHTPLLVLIGKDYNVYWEYRDGIMNISPVESALVLYQILDEDHFRGKPFIYVKPNYSEEKCVNIVKLAEENNGTVITCPHWAYTDIYYALYNQRQEVRKYNNYHQKLGDIGFVGSHVKYHRIIANHTDDRYKYPMYRSQLNFLKYAPENANRIEDTIPYPSRQDLIDKLNHTIPVKTFTNTTINECIQIYLNFRLQFQPHGVGPTHSIYECMMLGVPSLIPECSYLDDVTRKNNIVCDEFLDNIPTDVINEILQNEKKWNELKDGLIDSFERYMTHTAIIDCVFDQLKELI